MPRPALALLLGLVAGFLSGMFGIGGGLAMVPGLVLFLRQPQHRAHATSMAAIVVIAAAAAAPFAVEHEIDWVQAAWLVSGSSVGAVLGARLISRVSPVWLARAFVSLSLVAAVRLGFGS